MVVPEPELAPVMPPVIVPTVQVKVLGTLAVNPRFAATPLHLLAVAELVTEGIGFTVTVMVYTVPEQEFVVSVAITRYCTVPAEVPGLVSV